MRDSCRLIEKRLCFRNFEQMAEHASFEDNLIAVQMYLDISAIS